MKIPRDINGIRLALLLSKYGNQIIRQTGSHIRLTTNSFGEHHITIPAHSPIKIGTLSAILKDIANHLKISKEQLINSLFD
ncbi:MAG TPA: type II toxin-antitoxin system HicA family toxin [Candidatus Kapabacteria bacterium]|nr:type II toxin-antitoxin system HicA family toxin [Candidatus Kapabacteria bacterium]